MSLDAAAAERKARLAKLASLKRKRPGAEPTAEESLTDTTEEEAASRSAQYISGRNYDLTTKGPKLGFEQQPESKHETVEGEALRISAAAAEQAANDEAEAQQGLDLFKLQPKKANWDLKRDLAERTKILDVRTQNAIARLVRERIQKAKETAQRKSDSKSDAEEELGVDGSTLVEAVHLREKEDEEDRRRAATEDEDIT